MRDRQLRVAGRPTPLFRAGDRGLTTLLTYVLALLVVALLTTGVFFGVSAVVEDQHEDALHSSMEVVGNRLASDLRTADRLAEAPGNDGTVRLTSNLPSQLAGSQYTVTITNLTASDRYRIVVKSVDPDITVTVTLRSDTPIKEGTFYGDTLEIRYDSGTNELVVSDASN